MKLLKIEGIRFKECKDNSHVREYSWFWKHLAWNSSKNEPLVPLNEYCQTETSQNSALSQLSTKKLSMSINTTIQPVMYLYLEVISYFLKKLID